MTEQLTDTVEAWPLCENVCIQDGEFLFRVNREERTVQIEEAGTVLLTLKLAAVEGLRKRLGVLAKILDSLETEETARTPVSYDELARQAVADLQEVMNPPATAPDGATRATRVDMKMIRPGDRLEWEAYLSRKQRGILRSGACRHQGVVLAVSKPYTQAWEMEWAEGWRCTKNDSPPFSVTVWEGEVAHINPKSTFFSWVESKTGIIVKRDTGVYSSARDYTVCKVWRQGVLIFERVDAK